MQGRYFLRFDISELKAYRKHIESVARNSDKRANFGDRISTDEILRTGAVVLLGELIAHTPSGEDGSNWGAWDYGDYYLYGGDHHKNTLKRGWVTKRPNVAEYKSYWKPTLKDTIDFVNKEVEVKHSSTNRCYMDLENCAKYAAMVEYGHRIVLPGERNADRSTKSDSLNVKHGSKHTAVGRWVPGKYFVKNLPNTSWAKVSKATHEEYLKQLIKVLKYD